MRSEIARPAAVDADLVRRLDRSGPRYTSYPTAVEFHAGIGAADYERHLALADAGDRDAAFAIYVHIPFCERSCSFCACHFVATPQHSVARRYLDRLAREIALVAARLPRRRRVSQLSWGGGTPTFLSPAELEELHAAIATAFELAPDAEKAIEVDPRVTTREQLETLARLGFNRLSLGVQDFDPEVQEAIGRRQTFEQTRRLVEAAREVGFDAGINFDLVYGLPRQELVPFERGLGKLVELRPDRVAIYSFAFVPWAKPHQKRIDAAALPGAERKIELALAARERLADAGYESVGLDHWALPGDELARAARERRLERNFMGYSPRAAATTIAFGVSGIGDVEGAYFQNHHRLATWEEAIDAGALPIERGLVLDADDLVRRHVIHRLLCDFRVGKRELRERFDVDFDSAFAVPLARLADWNRSSPVPLVENRPEELAVTETGRLFVRNVCLAFDRYLEARQAAGRPVFSRTV